MKQKIAFGILSWSGDERRSNRYGSIFVGNSPFMGDDRVEPMCDDAWLKEHVGLRVRLTARIVESRVSTHVGDAGLDIRPPEVAPLHGTEVDLGVGFLYTQSCPWEPHRPMIVLAPNDGRDELWIDPRKLYVLHDQTVEVFAELTTDEFTPAPELECKEGAFDNGDGESFQVKKRGEGFIPATTERIGEGMFLLHPAESIPGQFGRPVRYEELKKSR